MIDPLDEAFRYGRGVFETVRVSGGRALLQTEHLDSMNEAAIALGLDNSRIEPGGPPGPSGIWRWYLTPMQFLTTWDDAAIEEVDGIELGLSRLVVSSVSWEARYKTLSYLLQIQARERSITGWDVLRNEHGQVAGATMANLFWVSKGEVRTPALECGCRNGAVRRWILVESPCTQEVEARPEELDTADEIFLTNSRIGVVPVLRWNEREMTPGPVTLDLQARLRRMIAGD